MVIPRGCLPVVLSLRPPRGGPAGSAGFIRRAENGGNGPGLRRFRDALGSFWGCSRPREERVPAQNRPARLPVSIVCPTLSLAPHPPPLRGRSPLGANSGALLDVRDRGPSAAHQALPPPFRDHPAPPPETRPPPPPPPTPPHPLPPF